MKAELKGKILTITVNLDDEKLLSPSKCHQLLPCLQCYRLGWISAEIVSYVCQSCFALSSVEDGKELSVCFGEGSANVSGCICRTVFELKRSENSDTRADTSQPSGGSSNRRIR